jgi:hypothetical protein
MSLVIFNQYARSTFQELLAQNIALFNAATKGALLLRSASNDGNFSEETLYARISGLVRRRNVAASDAVTAVDIDMLTKNSVKVAAGTPPVNIDPHYWSWIQRSPEEAGVVLGKQLAEDMLADMLSVGIKANVAALANVGATVVHDGTAGVASFTSLNSGAALYGDRSNALVAWIMTGKSYHDLIGNALTNTQMLFTFGTVNVAQDGLGRPFVVTDAAELAYTSSGQKYRVLGLPAGAVLIEQNPDYLENVQTSNGSENIKRTFQAEWTYNLALKGFAWDKTNGGACPSNAALATGTNWDKYATSVKDLSGVIVNVQ